MRRTAKKSKFIVTSLCGVAFAASLLGGVMFANNSTVSASAEDTITVVDSVASSGFEMTAGAAIKVVEGENGGAGIRWETNVSDAFITYLTEIEGYQSHSFHTLATGVNMLPENGTIADVTPDLKKSDGTTAACQTLNGTLENGTYYGSIVYGGEQWATVEEADRIAYYQTELIARAYVKVVKTVEDENVEQIIYAKADDTRRSMQAVAAEHKITGGKEDVSNYLGEVAKDEEDMVAYYDADNTKVIDTNAPDGRYIAYLNAKKLGVVDVENGSFTLADLGVEAGKTIYHLNLFNQANNLYSVDFVNPTKIIRTADDLKTFNFANEDFTSKVWTTTIDGYYVLGDNIDCTDTAIYSHGNISWQNTDDQANGFVGTFDGRGYTIKNLTFSGANITYALDSAGSNNNRNNTYYSLFGLLGKNSVVKNVAITNVMFDAHTNDYNRGKYITCSVIANYIVASATVENVYIDIFGITSADQDSGGGYTGFTGGATLSALSNRLHANTKINNVVIDMTLGAATIVPTKTSSLSTNGWNEKLTNAMNVVVISDKTLEQGDVDADASNIESATNKIENTHRYETRAAWKTALNGSNPFGGNALWKMVDGTPYWHNYTFTKDSSYELYLDADKTALTEEDIVGIAEGESIVSASSNTAGYTVTYTNGAIAVAKTDGDVDYMGEVISVAFKTANYTINVNVRLVTDIITTAEGLQAFNFCGASTATVTDAWSKKIDGYYVLGNDINGAVLYTQGNVTSGHQNNNESYWDTGFVGTFDGRGYTIDNLTFSGSNIGSDWDEAYRSADFNIFGILGNTAVVKNVAITNVKYDVRSSKNCYSILLSVLASYIMGSARVENVYIDVAGIVGHDSTTDAFTNGAKLSGIANRIAPTATFSNVVVNMTLDVLVTGGYTNDIVLTPTMTGALYVDGYGTLTGSQFSNVIVISDKTMGYNVEDSITTATRYANLETLKTATTEAKTAEDYTAFTSTGYWTWDETNGLTFKLMN